MYMTLLRCLESVLIWTLCVGCMCTWIIAGSVIGFQGTVLPADWLELTSLRGFMKVTIFDIYARACEYCLLVCACFCMCGCYIRCPFTAEQIK